MKVKFKNKGFTLVELLIYTTVFAMTAGLLTAILITTTRVQNVETVNNQIGQELNLVLKTVQRLVGDASLIECVGDATNVTDQSNCSLSTVPGSFLRLRFIDPTGGTKDPKCIYLDNGVIKLAEGENLTNRQYCNLSTATNLTSPQVRVANPTDLKFTKFNIPGGHATVQIEATLAYNSTNPDLQNISRTLRSAVGRVSAATFDSDLIPDADNLRNLGQIGGAIRKWKNLFVSNLLGLGTAATDPTSTTTGTLYYNTTSKLVKVYDGTTSTWSNVSNWLTFGNNTYYTAGNVGIGTMTPSGIFSVTPTQYSTGTASQLLTTVTGIGTTFTSAMVGSQLVYANGVSAGTITAFISATALTVSTSQTVVSQAYNIAYTGLQVGSTGNIGIGTTNPSELLSLGLTGTTKGVLSLAGNTSGKIIIQPANNTGTWSLTLPTVAGSSGQFLQTDGTGITSWAVPGGGSKFSGDGSDGVCCAGAIPVNLGGVAVFVKNYSSISITGTNQLIFTNPNVNGTLIILKSKGDVAITCTVIPCIDASGMGASGGSNGISVLTQTNAGNTGNSAFCGGSPCPPLGAASSNGISYILNTVGKIIRVSAGAGGGAGGNVGTSGARGGGGLIIEAGGNWNFTTAGGISVAGSTAAAAGGIKAGGGGGGAGGVFTGLYGGTLIANTGTVNVNGGGGGQGGPGDLTWNGTFGGGGAGGANRYNGGNGGDATAAGGVGGGTGGGAGGASGSSSGGGGGGGGAAGDSYIAQNTDF